MKSFQIAAVTTALFASLATAELDVPRSVFRVDQLAEAKAEAVEKEKPLVFVYTDPGTT